MQTWTLAKAIKGKSIVLLGEQDHGDAPTFLAKTRLVKFLHQKLGFDVIAFESDFYGLTKGQELYKNSRLTIDEFVQGNIFPIWTKCDACTDLFSYIKATQETGNPLTVTGFDNQLHGAVRRRQFKEDMIDMLDKASIDTHLIRQLKPLLDIIQVVYPLGQNQNVSAEAVKSYSYLMDTLVNAISHLPDSSYTKILVQSLRANVYQGRYHNENNYQMMMKIRDEQMASNFKWIFKLFYPGKKVIVWAHNYHIAKNTFTAMSPPAGKHTSMGDLLSKTIEKDMYVLGFTSYEGNAGRIFGSSFTVPKPKKKSIESWMKMKGPYSFLDFTQWKPETRDFFFMKGKFHKNDEARWNEVFDGVFFIETMYPCKRIE